MVAPPVQVVNVTSLTMIFSDFSIGLCSEQAHISLGGFAKTPGQVLAGEMLQVGYPANQLKVDLEWVQASQKAHILP